jgi:hypothetical protein
MKKALIALKAPIGAVVFLLALLLLLLFLPDPLQLKRPNTLAHGTPLILRHAPAPVMRHVRDVRHP